MPDTQKWGIFSKFYSIFININNEKFPVSKNAIFSEKGITNANLATMQFASHFE